MQALIICLCLLLCTTGAHAGEWIADDSTGCKVWNPIPAPGESISWSGSCSNQKANGYGILQWYIKEHWYSSRNETDNYEGTYVDGHMGQGTYKKANGFRYEGEWRNSLQHGKGIATYADGSSYEGNWQDGKIHKSYNYNGREAVSYGHIGRYNFIDTDSSEDFVVSVSIKSFTPALKPPEQNKEWGRSITFGLASEWADFFWIDVDSNTFNVGSTGKTWKEYKSLAINNDVNFVFMGNKSGALDVFVSSKYFYTLKRPTPLKASEFKYSIIGTDVSYTVTTITEEKSQNVFLKVREELVENKDKVIAQRERDSREHVDRSGYADGRDMRERQETNWNGLAKFVAGVAIAGAVLQEVSSRLPASSSSSTGSGSSRDSSVAKAEAAVKSGSGSCHPTNFKQVRSEKDELSRWEISCSNSKNYTVRESSNSRYEIVGFFSPDTGLGRALSGFKQMGDIANYVCNYDCSD